MSPASPALLRRLADQYAAVADLHGALSASFRPYRNYNDHCSALDHISAETRAADLATTLRSIANRREIAQGAQQ